MPYDFKVVSFHITKVLAPSLITKPLKFNHQAFESSAMHSLLNSINKDNHSIKADYWTVKFKVFQVVNFNYAGPVLVFQA